MSSRQLDEEAIFQLARHIGDLEHRATYLDQICAGDQQLRERVEALLQVHEQEQEFLKSDVAPTEAPAPITESPGQQIGRYKLREQIGEGGMGVVFVAEQERPIQRKVALKIIKPGMDTKEVIARFEAERQALALMNHPNIAKVLDAGTTQSGRPYFVMELVQGIPITAYCDRYKLTTRQRLELFVTVCQAVQHAHQKGVIHRDLKPSNVMITEHDGKPVVKVIDFGVAKAINQRLTEQTIYTRFQQMIGTPMYMSPEQAELSGLDVDTRSDVYSLGVLLYEVLTGNTPFDKQRFSQAAYDEIRRIIREEEPPKPSTKISSLGATASEISDHRQTDPRRLSQALRGELDWIVMKALEKDRRRRYETANGLATDIQRYLDDEPIRACPPSTGYRFRKFVRRHRGPVATATALLILLCAGIAGTVTGWIDAVRARHIAESRSNEAIVAREQESKQRRAAESAEEAAKQLVLQLSDTLFDQGLSAIFSGNYELAERRIVRLRDVGADQLATKLQALMLVMTNEIDSARDLILRELEKRPRSIAYLSLLARCHEYKGDYKEAWLLSDQIAALTPVTHADHLLSTLAPTFETVRVQRFEEALKFGKTPLLMLMHGQHRAGDAMDTGDVELADQSLREVNAAREMFGSQNYLVRAMVLKTAVFTASARRAQGLEWKGVLADVEDVALAIERAGSPTLLERMYLGLYHRDRGEYEKALFQFKQADAETNDVTCVCFYLALASERNAKVDPEYITTLKQRTDPRFLGLLQMSLGWYLVLEGHVDEALEMLGSWEASNNFRIASVLYATGATSKAQAVAAQWASDTQVPALARLHLTGIVEDWDDADFLAAAADFNQHWQAMDKHYLLGVKNLGRRELRNALRHFEECVGRHAIFSPTHIWARALVSRLQNMTTWPPKANE